MKDAQAPLLAGMVAALKASAAVTAIVGDRIYDRVPTGKPGPVHPYISFGPFESADLGGSCPTGVTVDTQVNGWSRAVGSAEGKALGAAIVAALGVAFAVEGFVIKTIAPPRLTGQTGLDGLTTETKARLRFTLSPTA